MGLDLAGAARLMVVLESLGPEGTRGPLDYLCVALMAGARFDQLPGVRWRCWPGSRLAG